MQSKLELLRDYWKTIVIIAVPIVLAIIPLCLNVPEARCGYVILVMAAFWMTEALPLAITALIPVFAFPLLGVLSTGECCLVYMKETNMMFLGGLTVAIAVEHCNLHKRIALFVILHVGQSPRRLMAGFMLTTMFLSMWISNTASTAMMVPIVDAILVELYSSRDNNDEENATSADLRVAPVHQSQMELVPTEGENGVSDVPSDKENRTGKEVVSNHVKTEATGLTTTPPDEECRALRDMCFLATAYAANLGGTGSLTGTGPNLVVKAVLSRKTKEVDAYEKEIGFVQYVSKKARWHSDVELEKEHKAFSTMANLSFAYAANIGGTGTLTGTNPNLIFYATMKSKEEPAPKTPEKEVAVEETPEGKKADLYEGHDKETQHEIKLLRRSLLLGVAYSANTGGTGVITGTSPNLVIMAVLSDSFSEPTGLNFASWMAFNVPGMIICVILAWIWLQILFMGLFRKKSPIQEASPDRIAAVKRLIKRKYDELGPMTQHEATVLTLFITLVLLWLFRAPEFVPGWASWFSDAFAGIEVDDATPAMLIVCLLFILPAKFNFFGLGKATTKPSAACMTWKVVQEKIPWGVVLLLGGGFAMAEGANKSGLSSWLGDQLVAFQVMPKEAIVFVVSLMTAMLTEVASNTATASILLPVLKDMALKINVNPLYLMLPAAVCCSYAFMLPVATPPNAIVFSAANMRSTDMMKAGFMMNIICVCVMTVMINTLGVALFDLHTMPAWTNSTIALNSMH